MIHKQNNVDPHLFQLLWQGLQSIRANIPIDDQYDSYLSIFQLLFHAQAKIGWDQLYYGRISTLWAQYITTSSQYKTNGDVFYAQITGLIWNYIFNCWRQQNQHLHEPTAVPPDHVLAEQV